MKTNFFILAVCLLALPVFAEESKPNLESLRPAEELAQQSSGDQVMALDEVPCDSPKGGVEANLNSTCGFGSGVIARTPQAWGWPGYHHYPPRPYPPRQNVQCWAMDGYGRYFGATGYDPYWAQNQALQYCFMYSNWGCHNIGCQYF